MKKNNVRAYAILAIVLVVFSVIAFVAPFDKNTNFWVAYLFGVIAIAFQLYVYHISFAAGEDAKSKFYGFPIAKIGVIYMGAQLLVSLVAMIVSSYVPSWIFIIADVLLLAVAAIGCITADTMRDEIVRQDQTLQADVSAMRALQSLASSIAGQCDDDELKPVLQNLSDEFRYSDPISGDQTRAMEAEMEKALKEIQQSVLDGNAEAAKSLSKKLLAMLTERNRICKLNK